VSCVENPRPITTRVPTESEVLSSALTHEAPFSDPAHPDLDAGPPVVSSMGVGASPTLTTPGNE